MDDKSDMKGGRSTPAGNGRAGDRPSLVERAARKMTTSATRPHAAPTPVPPAVPGEQLPEEAELEEAVLERAVLEEAVLEPVVQGAPAAAAAGEPPARAGAGTGAGAGAGIELRRARSVDIDLTALQARHLITPLTKRNRTLEEFRLIKRMVLSRRWDEGDAPGNTILVTSALPSEGKTTTAVNLAMSIAAEEDLRVVLVDADFVKPDALRQLGVRAGKGLIDVLHDPRMDLSDVILRTNIDKLSLIPSGQLHDRCTELLASARMDELITELAHRYEDRILIFDSPPILATTESVTLASHMGQIVFVVQAGRTKRETVASALELIGDRPHLGMVLNRTRSRFGKTEFGTYYGSYYYGYGHDRGGSEGRE